ncbi:(2Fe-2S) ferredoxin domain-containing protein [Mesoterricola sediminis]|uniref:(2Fe-2S) ferredoxin domain-containing protein n=1 Tax=Mesoterricola sediminis TaxID=2927980 RepID=A0AA48GPY6_9BACT|nr:(2Fe-2S) ferredoxin domain-containing protein [Mesoterricola sediminis]BDU75432.1 hypothetical protein METESE_03900 [Mesoterricola sediminis]
MPAIELVVCMGSACFSRGNVRVLELIQTHLRERGLADAVKVKGTLCQDRCRQGPNLTLQGECFCGLGPDEVIDLVEERVAALQAAAG